MKISLRAKIEIFVTLVILFISIVSTYLFVSQHKYQIENAFIARGTTLSHLFSRIVREGIEKEKLDLIEKAAFIIQAEDVTNVRVYTDLWDLMESYPESAQQQNASIEDAMLHFAGNRATASSGLSGDFYIKKDGQHYCFFHKVVFQPYEKATLITIGYVMVDMSTQHMQAITVQMIRNNIIAAFFIAIATVLALNILIGRIIGRPITDIHRSVKQFKEGIVSEIKVSHAQDEIGDLAREFKEMSRTIKEKENKLIESERTIASLFERVEHAIFRLDQDGTIVKTNGKYNEMFGGKNGKLCDILLGEKRVRDHLGNGIFKAEHLEEKAVGKNGDELIVLLSLYADIDPAGSIKGVDGYMLDITDRRKAEKALEVSEEYYRTLFENAHDMIQSVGPDGRFLFVNPAWIKTLGYSPDDLKTMALFDIIHPDCKDFCSTAFQRVLSGEAMQNVQTTFRAKDGRKIEVEGNVSTRFSDGRVVATQGIFRDITDRKQFEDYLKTMAHYDNLTGLPNRALFNDRLRHAMTAARRTGQKLALLYLDLDNFKPVNDMLGHNTGDLLLREAAERVKQCVRESDTVARLGGDEFCIILADVKDSQSAVLVSKNILDAIQQPFFIKEFDCRIGTSIGISLFPDHGTDAETLIKNADIAMYNVKSSGKNNFRTFSPDMSDTKAR